MHKIVPVNKFRNGLVGPVVPDRAALVIVLDQKRQPGQRATMGSTTSLTRTRHVGIELAKFGCLATLSIEWFFSRLSHIGCRSAEWSNNPAENNFFPSAPRLQSIDVNSSHSKGTVPGVVYQLRPRPAYRFAGVTKERRMNTKYSTPSGNGVLVVG